MSVDEFFGKYNRIASSDITDRIYDPRSGRGSASTRNAINTINSRYTPDSLARRGNTLEARVLGVQLGVPAQHRFPELYENATSETPATPGSPEEILVPEYFLFVLRSEFDFFVMQPESTSIQNTNQAADIAMMQGTAISSVPAAAFGPVGSGDIVKVYLPNLNSYAGARVLEVTTRNALDPIIAAPDPNFPFWAPPATGGPGSSGPVAGYQGAGGSLPWSGAAAPMGNRCTLSNAGQEILEKGFDAYSAGTRPPVGFWYVGSNVESIETNASNLQTNNITQFSYVLDVHDSDADLESYTTGDRGAAAFENLTRVRDAGFEIAVLIFPKPKTSYITDSAIESLATLLGAAGSTILHLDLEENWGTGKVSGYDNLDSAGDDLMQKLRAHMPAVQILSTTIISTARRRAKSIINLTDGLIGQSYFSNNSRFGGYDNGVYGMGTTQKTYVDLFTEQVIAAERATSTGLEYIPGLFAKDQQFNCEPGEITMARNYLSAIGASEMFGLPKPQIIYYWSYGIFRGQEYSRNFFSNIGQYVEAALEGDPEGSFPANQTVAPGSLDASGDTTSLCTNSGNISFFTNSIEKINRAFAATEAESYTNTYDGFVRFFNTVIGIAAESEPNFTPESVTPFQHQTTARNLYRAGQHLSSGERISGTVVERSGRLHALPDKQYWDRLIPLIVIMQLLRDEIDSPITLRNLWRPVAYNRAVDGAANSAHIYGTGVDLYINDSEASKRAQELMYALYTCTENFDVLGLGFGQKTTHFDINTPSQSKRRGWLYSSFNSVRRAREGAYSPSWNQHT